MRGTLLRALRLWCQTLITSSTHGRCALAHCKWSRTRRNGRPRQSSVLPLIAPPPRALRFEDIPVGG
ncbi:hypothetical protein PF005_g19793 [Phytophthora fragariae]|uniref:Secreted protein n=2 Tax=Phytophthora TaxID=4783 RepID=A0A6A3WQ30_9STRA|nr:hypothetical protein PF009_g20716 [Phytophthora fragariae]KAE9022682.1 hypothetical protein PR002_g11912 [Phytophthora rubi]KAE9088666.1 hypothetical protein PF007_g19886 [Phytophthora fragariae]KAE9189080.1 hypothetical protein PF005_g19793 [Phytophthora fragariae]KAE9201752.1 hypothetical protein PF004_g18621 [Phytophthora fragariae]